jgi:hypothetical protein
MLYRSAHFPIQNFPKIDPRTSSVAVGRIKVGPTPHVNEEAAEGEIKAVKLRSPRPFTRPSPVIASGWEITGSIVRVMRFQSSPKENG